MYHESVVQRRVEKAIAAGEVYYTLPVGDGRTVKRFYEPTWHNIAEVEASVGILNDLVDQDSGKLKNDLDEAQIAFIANERFLCRLDYKYYATRYCWIKDEAGNNVRYSPRVPQKIFQDIVAEHDLNQWPIELQVLKARQLGMSRETSLMFGHRAIFWAGTNAELASADPDKSTKLAEMMKYPIERLPWWLAPTPQFERHGEYIIYKDQDSTITIEAGNQLHGLARGTTIQLVHLSELCEFDDPKELVEASLFPTIHPSRWTFLVFESTALGRGNWWHETWQLGVSGWATGRSRLRPVFLPWFTGSDIYPQADWIQMHRQHVETYSPAQFVIEHARAAEAYVRSNDLLSKHLGSNWKMSREQMFWYETKRDEYKAKGILNKFLAEYCSSADEAFQSTNISVFDTETISSYRTRTRGKEPVGVFGFTAHESLIPRRLQPSAQQIDQNKPKIDINYPWGNQANGIRFTLEPLKWQGYDESDNGLGKLYIYEWPDFKSSYGIGVDTADGVGQDRSVLNGLRKGNNFQRPGQVFEYASDYVNAHDLWPMAACMAALYAVPFGGILKQPRMAIEIKGNGDTVQHELMKRGYNNMHPWYRIDTKTINPGKAHKLGVYTVQWFRSQMMDWLIKYLRDELIDIGSPFFVKEMESLEASEWTQGIKAAHGEHDDRIMSLGFALVSLFQLEIQRGQTPEELNPRETQYATFTPPSNGLVAGREAMLAKMGRPAARVPAQYGGVSRRYL